MFSKFKKKFLGDKKFYIMVLSIALPIMLQNGITNFVSLLDNIMIGRVGTNQMSGVAIVNQLMFVFNLCIFGAVSGAGIFGAQFFGKRDYEGMKYTFRFKIITCTLIMIIGAALFYCLDDELITLYLKEGGETGDLEATLMYGKQYMAVMIIGLFPFALTQAYASALRESGKTVVPMLAGIAAVVVNLVLNYILIYGKFGAPVLGVRGAAIATLVARFIEFGIVVVWTHAKAEQNPYIIGVYKSLRIPGKLAVEIIKKGMPLLVNETLWAAGMTFLMQQYATRGLAVVAALNISSTIANLFNIVFMSLGVSIGIIVGQMLGADEMQKAKETVPKLMFFSVASCILTGGLMDLLAPLFPRFYNTTDEVKNLAFSFIIIAACCMPMYAFTHASYFTLRSGGKTLITFLFDSVYVWVVVVPVACALTYLTNLPIVPLYLLCQLVDIIKCTVGYILVKKGVWMQNIVTQVN